MLVGGAYDIGEGSDPAEALLWKRHLLNRVYSLFEEGNLVSA